MKPEEFYFNLVQTKQAYQQAKKKVDDIILKKYEFIRSVYAEDLHKVDPAKAEFRIKKAKAEEEFVKNLIAYMEIFEEMAKMNALEANVLREEAKTWNDAYKASIDENLEFTKLMMEKNVKAVYNN